MGISLLVYRDFSLVSTLFSLDHSYHFSLHFSRILSSSPLPFRALFSLSVSFFVSPKAFQKSVYTERKGRQERQSHFGTAIERFEVNGEIAVWQSVIGIFNREKLSAIVSAVKIIHKDAVHFDSFAVHLQLLALI